MVRIGINRNVDARAAEVAHNWALLVADVASASSRNSSKRRRPAKPAVSGKGGPRSRVVGGGGTAKIGGPRYCELAANHWKGWLSVNGAWHASLGSTRGRSWNPPDRPACAWPELEVPSQEAGEVALDRRSRLNARRGLPVNGSCPRTRPTSRVDPVLPWVDPLKVVRSGTHFHYSARVGSAAPAVS
jgi:hypothetical protein